MEAFPKRKYPHTRLDGVITHATVMKHLLPLKRMILYGSKRSSGYRGLFSQGIRQPECEADRLPPAGADRFLPGLLYMLHSAVKPYRGIALPLFTPMLPTGFVSCHSSQRTCQNEHRCGPDSNPVFFLLGGLALKPLPEHPLYWCIFLMFLGFCTITLPNFVVSTQSVR